MRLRIKYRDFDGARTEREIRDIRVDPSGSILAFCLLRDEDRTFQIERIEQAYNCDTGTEVEDLRSALGLPAPPPKDTREAEFNLDRAPKTAAESESRRVQDKRFLFRRFRNPILIRQKKAELYALFGNCCFACGTAGPLDLDHHVPQSLGGRLIPGNIVVLCRSCNLRKKSMTPQSFYTQAKLDALQQILEQEVRLFDFKWDTANWVENPTQYLASLGVVDR